MKFIKAFGFALSLAIALSMSTTGSPTLLFQSFVEYPVLVLLALSARSVAFVLFHPPDIKISMSWLHLSFCFLGSFPVHLRYESATMGFYANFDKNVFSAYRHDLDFSLAPLANI